MELMDVILASKSPRRKELLRRLFPDFRVVPSAVDESVIMESDPVRFAVTAAEAKARDAAAGHPDSLVIGADTIVCLGDEIFGKPVDRADAEAMLGRLSGRKHRVITGVALYRKSDDKLVTSHEITYVVFRPIPAAEIAAYLDGHEYLDKAGGYAVQDCGDAFVEKLDGDYNNVVGFPVRRVKRMLKEWAAPEQTIDVEGIDFKTGWGFGLPEGLKTLVPGAVPGDRLRGRIMLRKPRSAKIIRIERTSPWRVEAPCPHFGACGGCAFQNLSYDKQLELKQAHFERTLREGAAAAVEGAVFEPIIPSPALFGYRNKMEFAFGGEAGAIRLGLRSRSLPGRRTFLRTVALRQCPLIGESAERVFPAVLEFAAATGLPPYDPLGQRGFFRNLVLRVAKSTGEIMVVFVTRSGGGIDSDGWAAGLAARVPEVRSVWHVENDRVADLVDFEHARLVRGAAHIEEELGGLRFRIGPESFFQPNPRAALLFYEKIAERAREIGARRALGLFCGPGAIELFLARSVGEVEGIDSEARNIQDAEENARRNGLSQARFRRGLVEKVVDDAVHRGFDFLVLDPPREGLRPEGLTRVLGLRIPNIAYMSCHPASLARDVFAMAGAGYRLERVFSADFFPHTPHMEALAFFHRKG